MTPRAGLAKLSANDGALVRGMTVEQHLPAL